MAFDRIRRTLADVAFARFVLAGAVNTFFGWLVFAACSRAGASGWVALLVGTVAGIAFNFLTLGGYAFRQLTAARLPRFVAAYLAVYAINLALLEVLGRWVPSVTVAQALLTAPMALLSWLLMSRFVFASPPPA